MWVSNLNIGLQSLSYLKWAPNEPYQNTGVVILWKKHNCMWDDAPVSSENYFVCRKVCIHLCCFNDWNSFWIITVPVHGLLYSNISYLQTRSCNVICLSGWFGFVPIELRIFTPVRKLPEFRLQLSSSIITSFVRFVDQVRWYRLDLINTFLKAYIVN